MTTCLSNDELVGLVADSLPQERCTQAEAHLAECESCRRRLEELCRRQLAAHEAEDPDHASSRPGSAVETVATPRSPSSLEETEFAAGPTGPPRDSIEGYEILSEVHRGGQGVVYKAVQKSTKRTVAVKVLLQGPYASERQRRRFEREIDLAAGLKHPNIVTVYDSGVTRDGRHYCAMEYVHGEPLDGYLLTHDLDIDGRLSLFAKVGAAVS
ncbi:MAG: protein kinase, partial [Phycisphaerales bacterium]